jgi:hypothetical protein
LDQKAGLLIAGTTDPQSPSQHQNGIGKDIFSPVLGRYSQSLIHWSVLLQAEYESKFFTLDNTDDLDWRLAQTVRGYY